MIIRRQPNSFPVLLTQGYIDNLKLYIQEMNDQCGLTCKFYVINQRINAAAMARGTCGVTNGEAWEGSDCPLTSIDFLKKLIEVM